MTTSTPLPCRAILALALALVSLLPRPGSAAAADSAGVWSPIAAAGAPSARSGQVAVWTGKELLIWGGVALDTSTVLGDGAAYDPGSNTWRPISRAGAPRPRYGQSAVWTGARMLIWGGEGASDFTDGAAYDPATRSSERLRPSSAFGPGGHGRYCASSRRQRSSPAERSCGRLR